MLHLIMSSSCNTSMESVIAPIIKLNKLVTIQVSEDDNAKDYEDQLNKIKEILNNHELTAAEFENRIKYCQHPLNEDYCKTSVFVAGCLTMLGNVKTHLMAVKDDSTPVLSVSQEQEIVLLVHFIVNTGLVRHFDFQVTVSTPCAEERPQCRYEDLNFCTRQIISICENDLLRRLILPKFLLQLLGALLMLSYSPECRMQVDKDQRMFFLSKLTVMITKWSKLHDVAYNLLVLQGSRKRSSPPWLQKHCGNILSKCLLRKNGVSDVVSAMIASLDSDLSDFQKCEIVSQILSTPPHSSSNVESYCSNICGQIIQLLKAYTDTATRDLDNEHLMKALVSTLFSFYKKFSTETLKFFFLPILNPLQQIMHENTEVSPTADSIPMLDVSVSISITHIFLTYFKHSDKEVLVSEIFISYVPIYFHIFTWAREKWSPLATQLTEILAQCLTKSTNTETSAEILLVACGVLRVEQMQEPVTFKHPKHGVQYDINEEGECTISDIESDLRSPEDILHHQDQVVAAFTELLKHCDGIASDVFILLVQQLSNMDFPTSQSATLLMPEERISHHLGEGQSHLITFALVTSLCENTNPIELLCDVTKICHFVKIMLEKSLDENKEHAASNNENVNFCIAVLGLCLLTDLDTKQRESLTNILPVLQRIKESTNLSDSDKETIEDLMIVIATHGAAAEINIQSFSKSMQHQSKLLKTELTKKSEKENTEVIKTKDSQSIACNKTGVKPRLIEEIQEKCKVTSKTSEEKLINSINEAFESTHDPSSPIRTAGIRFLIKNIEHPMLKSPDQVKKMYEIFLQLLEDKESFVYLSAVQGLAQLVSLSSFELGKEKSSSLLEKVITKFDSLIQSNEDEEILVKLGEVIVRISSQLGDMAPYVAKTLIPVFLRTTRDNRATVRSSCLSNLAELCPLLRHSLSSFQYEVIPDGTPFHSIFSSHLVVNNEHSKNYKTASPRLS
ncbi:transport and Golgi organization protein 6 homolog isoform X2 [Ciona intestinalis]